MEALPKVKCSVSFAGSVEPSISDAASFARRLVDAGGFQRVDGRVVASTVAATLLTTVERVVAPIRVVVQRVGWLGVSCEVKVCKSRW